MKRVTSCCFEREGLKNDLSGEHASGRFGFGKVQVADDTGEG